VGFCTCGLKAMLWIQCGSGSSFFLSQSGSESWSELKSRKNMNFYMKNILKVILEVSSGGLQYHKQNLAHFMRCLSGIRQHKIYISLTLKTDKTERLCRERWGGRGAHPTAHISTYCIVPFYSTNLCKGTFKACGFFYVFYVLYILFV
jgi:hypothetical protein